jgi:hypothetical protein
VVKRTKPITNGLVTAIYAIINFATFEEDKARAKMWGRWVGAQHYKIEKKKKKKKKTTQDSAALDL